MLTSVRTSLFLFSMLVLSTGFSHAATAQIPPAPINNIGAAATKMASGKGFEIQQTTDGYQLSCRMQSMYADVTAKGVAIRSLAGKGSGTLSLRPERLGRINSMEQLPVFADRITRESDVVTSIRGNLSEEFTTSGDGIRQDFIIRQAPRGSGDLCIDLDIEGAKLSQRGDGILLKLIPSGRELLYGRLKVIDAAGHSLASRFVLNHEKSSLGLRVADAGAVYPIRIDPTITNANWSALGSGTGTEVLSIAIDGSGNVYAGGTFTSAGGVSANYIAKWNGSAWSSLGSGMNGSVYALAIDGSGNLYAGGQFSTAGGITVDYIAKWNGSVWSSLGSQMNAQVNSIAFDKAGNLYAGGVFTTAGGITVNYIAKWNGSTWSSLGSGTNGWLYYGLAFDSSGNLYAGGNFTSAGGVSANYIAKWNGSSWSGLGSGVSSTVYRVVVDGSGNVYAGGTFLTAGGVTVEHIALWNGSTWSGLGSGMNSSVYGLALDGYGNLYAGGAFTTAGGVSAPYIALWNGSAWSGLGSGMNASVYEGLEFDQAGNLYAGGSFTTAGGVSAGSIAKCAIGFPFPVLSSPSSGATVETTSPTLSWNSYSGAVSYAIQVSSTSSFSSTLIYQSTAGTSAGISGLANSTTYYWQANATAGTATSAWSPAWSFTTLAAVPPATPVIISPANAATNVPTNTMLSWNTLAPASYYLVEVSTDAAFGSFFLQDSSVTTGSRAASGLAGTTLYYWRVRASNAYGSSSWASAYFTTSIAAPSTPALSAPTNSSTNLATSLTLSWTTVASAVKYLVEVSTGSTFTNNFVQDSSPTSGLRAVTGLAYNTAYYWQVQASNAGGPSLWTATWSFTTLPPVPGVPSLSLPSNSAANQPIYQNLSWSSAAGAATYVVQVATVSTFGTTVTAQAGLTATTQAVGPLAFNTQYFWEVNATNTTGTGLWSTLWSFTTISGIPALSSPTNGATGKPTALQLSWGSITGASSYGFQVSMASNFSSTLFGSSGLTADTLTISGLGGNTQFYWRANAANPAGGTSAWSGTWSFATLSSPPILSQPANGATGVSISPTLSWNTVGNVSTFRLQVATDSLYSSIVKDTTLAAASYAMSNLSNISLYYWHVLATGIGGTSAWSSTWNFTTIYYPPPVPTLALPGTGSSNQPTSLILSWNSGGNASLWNVQVSTSATFASIFIQDSQLTTTLQPISGLANYATYYWRVDAGNSLGGRSNWTGAWSFVTTPATPVLAYPTNDAFGQPTTLTLNWGSIAGAGSYSLDISTDITFSTGVTNVAGITASSASVSGLANSTAYYWQVNTIVPGGISAWSGVWSFWTIFAPPVPALPLNGAIAQPVSSALSWGAVTGATSYSLQLSTASNFATTAFSQAGLTSTSVTPGNLAWYTTYYWKVNAANAGGVSLWSGVWSFTTSAHLVVPISSGWFMYSLNIHPADSSTSGVFSGLKGFILAMDGSDNLYWPGASLDEIGTIHTGSGYWVLDTLRNDTLNLTGGAVNIGSTPISLPASTWNLVSYLPQVNMPISTALAPINSQIVLAMDGSSNFYWPAASLNEIGTMTVGNGYYIVTSANASLNYPTAGSSAAKELSATTGLAKLANPTAPHHFAKRALTGNFAAFMAPHVEIGGKLAADNCEVGAYDTKGNLVGSGTVVNGLVAFAICGKDPAGKVKNGCLPSEKLTFKLWNGKTEYPLEVTRGSEPVFASRTILKATLAVPAGALISAFNLSRAYPNPFKGVVNIAFDVPTIAGVAQHAIEINIYDMKGALVKQLAKGTYQAGHYELPWNCNESREGAVGSSIYVVRMKAQNFEKRLKLIRVE